VVLVPIAALTDRILVIIEGWRERRRLRRELNDLPLDIPRLMKAHPGASRQLADMMRRLGIDRAAMPHMPRLRDIEWRCGECKNWRKCRRWLASRDAADEYRAFCPNAEAYDELRRAPSSPI
jgi:hypothetical protein